MRIFSLCVLALLALGLPITPKSAALTTDHVAVLTPDARFGSEIYAFLVEDELVGTPACRTLFVGSSSIRFWFTLEEDFPDRDVVNRGFGGAHLADVNRYFSAIVAPHRPAEIILYAGENDLNAGKSPDAVFDDLKMFMEAKTDALGPAPVYFVSVKPSPAREGDRPVQSTVNALAKNLAEERDDLTFVDVAAAMYVGDDPKPIYISDKLHMNAEGYRIWTRIISDALGARGIAEDACARAD